MINKGSERKDKAKKELKKIIGRIGKVSSAGKEREVRVYVVKGV